MKLVEEHIISKNHPYWNECDRLTFLSKNLYNQALYRIKQQYDKDKTFLSYYVLYKQLADENQVDYRALPQNVSAQVLMGLDKNMKAYFKALQSYQTNPSKFTGLPQLPKFKHKTKGRNICVYTDRVIRKKELKNGIISLTNTDFFIKSEHKDINQVTIVPLNNQTFKLCIIYEKQELASVISDNYCGIDIGVNNLATLGFNNQDYKPVIINGRPLKSINQFYNKKLGKLKSPLHTYKNKNGETIQISRSNKINKLTNKRNNKVKDYLHKASKKVVEVLQQNNISKVVIGKNDNWKTEINIGKENNQNFVSIPHAKFIEMIDYKCKLVGIEVIIREESYTSKCSFVDLETVRKHNTYLGKRIKRGLFKSSNGKIYNADLNGALNILKKEVPNCFANGIEGLVISPIVTTIK